MNNAPIKRPLSINTINVPIDSIIKPANWNIALVNFHKDFPTL